ncbi:MAG: SpoIVB peptidase [Oscillospiraceae bacterium]|nr:SpoIVB peptidase [Oscillospiraceae bacterium]
MTFSAYTGATAFALELVPVGRIVGIKLDTDGVVVVGVPDKCSDGATPSPAKAAGFRVGDIITKVRGADVDSCESLKALTNKNGGKNEILAVRVERCDETIQLQVKPATIAGGERTLGLWVRDGVSGIGTVTFYDPETKIYGALGHAINDADSGVLLPVKTGSISSATVSGVAKGAAGTPGQLHGSFDFDRVIGGISKNTPSGIFGTSESGFAGGAVTVADADEIRTGAVTIISNVESSEVREYSAEITRIYSEKGDGRSMMIHITDAELIAKTGGIVQGMSGSPILQGGKLIGAVTHVLINDPTRGYAVTLEKMLENSGIFGV